jgi:CRISPR-associated protein Csx17
LKDDKDIPADPRIPRLLASGDARRAIEIAATRIRSVGIRPPFQTGVTDPLSATLWGAALAFPIEWRAASTCMTILDPRLDPRKGMQHA